MKTVTTVENGFPFPSKNSEISVNYVSVVLAKNDMAFSNYGEGYAVTLKKKDSDDCYPITAYEARELDPHSMIASPFGIILNGMYLIDGYKMIKFNWAEDVFNKFSGMVDSVQDWGKPVQGVSEHPRYVAKQLRNESGYCITECKYSAYGNVVSETVIGFDKYVTLKKEA